MAPGTAQQTSEPPRGLSVAEAEQIASMNDPVLRNCCITLGYHELATAFASRDPGWANWAMFAVWASKQAGQTIRGDDLRVTLRRYLGIPMSWRSPWQSLWRALLRRGLFNPHSRLGAVVRAIPGPLDAFEHASRVLADGNQLIFSEIGRAFASYLATRQPGDVPGPLLKAFARYRAAAATKDPTLQAQLRYSGNVEIAWYEQTRAQQLITEALDIPLLEKREIGRRVLAIFGVRSTMMAPVIGMLLRPYARFSRALAHRVITEKLITLTLPGARVMELGRNIEQPSPECLAALSDSDLRELLSRFDGEASDCAAKDWADLKQRVRYIARLFRVCYLDMSLTLPPFTSEQVSAIRAGRLPEGNL